MLGNSAQIRPLSGCDLNQCLSLGKGKTSTQTQFHRFLGRFKMWVCSGLYLRLFWPCWFVETAPLSWGRLKTQLTNWCFKSPCKLETSANISTKLYIHTLNVFTFYISLFFWWLFVEFSETPKGQQQRQFAEVGVSVERTLLSQGYNWKPQNLTPDTIITTFKEFMGFRRERRRERESTKVKSEYLCIYIYMYV